MIREDMLIWYYMKEGGMLFLCNALKEINFEFFSDLFNLFNAQTK